ncbi:MAG: DUF1987 domain-containing protein [Sphingobacteriaceae bacterium]|nr:DUF1987 domain-containing protein [Sphingobacteriaceae bacterium]
MEAMDKYANSPQPTTVVTFELEYFNTSSSRSILSALRKLQSIHLAGSAVTINWLYEETDDDILEAGIEYGDIINIPFNMIKLMNRFFYIYSSLSISNPLKLPTSPNPVTSAAIPFNFIFPAIWLSVAPVSTRSSIMITCLKCRVSETT